MLKDGQGVAQDEARAVEWFRRAARQGNVLAQSNLGWMFYGYWRWVRGGSDKQQLPIRHFPVRLVVPWLLLAAAIWAAIYWLLVTFANSNVPVADSFTTALSIVGIWALAHKYLEQWFIWLAVDVVTCVLYFYKDIPFKASLYGLYVIIAIAGYYKWKGMATNLRP